MNLRLEDAIEQIVELATDSKELAEMVDFLRNVRRGILR
jgi:UDP-N-acetylglucosamine acyltransferase